MGIWPRLDQPAIITPNHQGYLDGPALAFLTPKPILFGVDPEFSTKEPWRRILLAIGRITRCRMVPMAPGSRGGLREMLRYLQDGGWVCLFPEGGIATGKEYPGARWIAERSGVSIHPLEIRAIGVGKVKLPYKISGDLSRDFCNGSHAWNGCQRKRCVSR